MPMGVRGMPSRSRVGQGPVNPAGASTSYSGPVNLFPQQNRALTDTLLGFLNDSYDPSTQGYANWMGQVRQNNVRDFPTVDRGLHTVFNDEQQNQVFNTIGSLASAGGAASERRARQGARPGMQNQAATQEQLAGIRARTGASTGQAMTEAMTSIQQANQQAGMGATALEADIAGQERQYDTALKGLAAQLFGIQNQAAPAFASILADMVGPQQASLSLAGVDPSKRGGSQYLNAFMRQIQGGGRNRFGFGGGFS